MNIPKIGDKIVSIGFYGDIAYGEVLGIHTSEYDSTQVEVYNPNLQCKYYINMEDIVSFEEFKENVNHLINDCTAALRFLGSDND